MPINNDIPDDTEIGIVLPGTSPWIIAEITPKFQEEFQLWEDLSADAWEKFLEWELETST